MSFLWDRQLWGRDSVLLDTVILLFLKYLKFNSYISPFQEDTAKSIIISF